MRVLDRIKTLVRQGDYRFTHKALEEMDADGLRESDVAEAILTADHIDKALNCRTPIKSQAGTEKLYVIKNRSKAGTPIYTKGVIRSQANREIYYILISSKIDRFS